jgi:hypothetical protein
MVRSRLPAAGTRRPRATRQKPHARVLYHPLAAATAGAAIVAVIAASFVIAVAGVGEEILGKQRADLSKLVKLQIVHAVESCRAR